MSEMNLLLLAKRWRKTRVSAIPAPPRTSLFCGASVCHDTIAAAFTIAEYFSNLSDILMLVATEQPDRWMSAGKWIAL